MYTPLRTHYLQDLSLFPDSPFYRVWLGIIFAIFATSPYFLSEFALSEWTFFLIYSGIGIALIFLTGYGGMLSLGQAAFLAIGGYTHSYLLTAEVPFAVSILVTLGISLICGFLLIFPIRRLKGIYLSIATLALGVLVAEVCMRWKSFTGGLRGMMVPPITPWYEYEPYVFYYVSLFILGLALLILNNLLRTPRGRAVVAASESELSAKAIGVNIGKIRVFAFTLCSGLTGVFGALLAHKLQFLTPEAFSPMFSIQLVLMVVIGGMHSLPGAFFGAFVILQIPQMISWLQEVLPPQIAGTPGLEPGLFGLILIVFVLFEPLGLYGRWCNRCRCRRRPAYSPHRASRRAGGCSYSQERG